jgi:hypothetical protein
MPAMLLHDDVVAEASQLDRYQRLVTRVFNALIPASSIKVEVQPYGVRYLHPTKGWRTVGKKRFAIRGVL